MLETAFRPALVAAVFGADHASTFPDVWFLAWFDENGDEITGTDYARREVPNDDTVWALTDDVAANIVDVDGGTPGDDDWPTIHGFGLYDEFGSLVISGELSTPESPQSGVPVVFASGDLTVTI